MKKVLNLLLVFAVFFGGWKLFPDIFQFRDLGAVVITVLLMYAVHIVYGLLIFLVAFLTMTSRSWKLGVVMIISILGIFFLNIISILLVSKFYSGFNFNGGFVALILTALALGLFSTDVNVNSNSSNSREIRRY